MSSDLKKTVLIFAILLIVQPILSAPDKHVIYIVNNKTDRVILNVEIADKQSEREKGLMFRRVLLNDHGMLFVFEEEKYLSFWMKNTYIPLDIAYISRSGVINEIYHMEPLDYSVTYPSCMPAMYALEVNAGWFRQNGIVPGMKLDFNGCIGK